MKIGTGKSEKVERVLAIAKRMTHEQARRVLAINDDLSASGERRMNVVEKIDFIRATAA